MMTTEAATEKRIQQTVKKVRGKRSATECDCEDGMPEIGEFEITGLRGKHCTKCMHVFSWEKVAGQPLRMLAGGMTLTSDPPKPKNKQLELIPASSDPVISITPTQAPVDTIDAFFVFDISRAEKPDQMFFHMETKGGKSFKVLVPSKAEKVERAMKDKSLIVCKQVQVEFKGYDSYGVPVLPKVLAMAK